MKNCHKLSIVNNCLKLDDFELLGVTSYIVEHDVQKDDTPKLTLTLLLESCTKLDIHSTGNDIDSDLR